MPRLLIFAACERVIVDQQTNVISLMSVLQDINVQIPPNAPPPPPNAIIPMHWTIIASYLATPGDAGKQFEHRAALVNASGLELVQTPVAVFTIVEQHRVVSQVGGMPVGNAGRLTLKCFLREKGTNNWTEMGEGYPINIKWLSSPAMIH